MTPSGTLTTLVSFDSINGAQPESGLIQASDGNFYGTTYVGGMYQEWNGFAYGYGTVFKMTPSGTLTTLVSFDSANGAGPIAELIQGSDGNLYGTTAGGGAYGYGTIFRINLNAPPKLNIMRTDTDMVFSWSASNVGFHLEENSDLSAINGWASVVQPASTNNDIVSVTLSSSGGVGSRFYRLKSP
jgi:uncharacterized repeat protein (TIGR03803 family)